MFQPMFVPPKHNRAVMGLTNALLPSMAPFIAQLRNVHMEVEDLERLAALGNERAILSPNHPTGDDPVVVMWVSRMLRHPFNYLCAREVLVGAKGWFLNQLGAYSVIRGVPDRESLRTTRRLLAEMNRKVVIFPEGEIYEHNDTLLAFQSGIAQIGFWTLDDLVKAQQTPHLPIVPIAIKYRCAESPRPAIDNSLKSLEGALDLGSAPHLTAYQRLLRVGDRVLTTLERELGVKPEEAAPLTQRIPICRRKMLDRVAHAIETEVEESQAPQEQIHLLFHALKQWVGLLPPDHNDYDERLYRRKMEIALPLFRDLHRLQNFIALSGDYVASEATAERFLETLGRLEVEVFGKVRNKVAREALVRVAAPIQLEERYSAYRQDKRGEVAAVTREMETTIRGMLQELSRRSTPIALDA
jgi:1-acyl-sn-glycerol-3-phosphate acyltransferase